MEAISWYEDDESFYFNVNFNGDDYKFRPDNTAVFSHSPAYYQIDHIFFLIDEGDKRKGYNIWRRIIEQSVGGFDDICADLIEHDYPEYYQDIPDDRDIESFENNFDVDFKPDYNYATEYIVKKALKDLDSEWAYYDKEWE